MNTLDIVTTVLAIFAAFIAILIIRDTIKNRGQLGPSSAIKTGIIGFIGNFSDALGIGSFAVITALLKLTKQAKDIDIPGTLNAGTAIPAAVETIIYMHIIKVDIITLVTMIAAGCIGAWIGAGIVTRFSERKIQIAMGTALLITAFFMFAGKVHWLPSGGHAIGLTGANLAIALAGSFVIGSLSAIGIGFFAPCMALVYFLGLSPHATFPIMMGASSFVVLSTSTKFIKSKRYNIKAALNIGIWGILGVLIAAFIVKELPTNTLQWLVIAIILYTSAIMLKSAHKNRKHN
ncbi:MAG: sulfite exporter TauE/SafE family protein [Gammaproteobacteria bacterium]|nr:sulfite exporter TauE/SafE family protein [Gammaproteobacteria bacterium]